MKCSQCKKHTPSYAFATFRTRKGEVRRRGVCKECRGSYAKKNFKRLQLWRRKYNKRNKSERYLRQVRLRIEARSVVEKLKSETPCADCGKKFPPVAMDFDHIGPKSTEISRMFSGGYKLDLIMAEIKLCEIVCACCHRIRTQKRKQNQSPKWSSIQPFDEIKSIENGELK